MSLSALRIEDKPSRYQPFSLYFDDTIKTLNYDHTPKTIPRRYYKQIHKTATESGKKVSYNINRHTDKWRKLKPDRGMVDTKLLPDGGIVGFNTGPKKGMVGMKVIKGGVKREEKEKIIASKRLKIEKEVCTRNSKSSKNAKPLGRLREYRRDFSIEHIPKLKKEDMDYEKEQNIQRIIKSLNLNSNPHYENSTITSRKKEPVIKNTSGIDFASSLMESHNLTLKQLREFWQDMPSFLNVQAAKLKSKYGVVESEAAADDIDDISIEIVAKWNKTTVILPEIEVQNSRRLYVVEEEI